MRFNSFEYIFLLAVTVCMYYILPLKARRIMLLLGSFAFYASWNAKYLLLMIVVILVTYIAAVMIVTHEKHKKTIMLSSVTIVFLLLFYFKYLNFVIYSINAVFKTQLDMLNIILPVGISFYVFQSVGYVIDVYRNSDICEKNIITYALFISFFPQLVAGPIERSKNMLGQFKVKHKLNLENIKNGITLVLIGLVEKVVIADRLAIFVTNVFDKYQQASPAVLILAVVFFAFQVYCDFNAYSLIAIGSAKMMGFKLMRNFNNPYLSRSFSEYWSRWHISLSTWFQDYIFTPFVWSNPLKKISNKFSNPPVRTGLFIVFIVSGFWHGANWTYVVWGLIHALYRIIGATIAKPKKKFFKKHKISQSNPFIVAIEIFIVFILNCFTYIFFRANTINHAIGYIKYIFINTGRELLAIDQFGLNKGDIIVSLVLIGILVISQVIIELKHKDKPLDQIIDKKNIVVQGAIYALLFLSLVVYGQYGINYVENPFIYFQF